jgi:hypothetical protein
MHKSILCLAMILALPGCAAATHFSNQGASGYWQLHREECVPYARRVSGVQLYGDACTWWNQAEGVYARGHAPAPGAVLVLAKTSRLKSGHLAVVSKILGPRDITVTHTNWGDDWINRRITYQSARVHDISPGNDWSNVRFWSNEAHNYGAPYPAYGFIYNMRERAPGYGAPHRDCQSPEG